MPTPPTQAPLDHSLHALLACAGQPLSKPSATPPAQQSLFDILLFLKTASTQQILSAIEAGRAYTNADASVPFAVIAARFPSNPHLLRHLSLLVRSNRCVLDGNGYRPA